MSEGYPSVQAMPAGACGCQSLQNVFQYANKPIRTVTVNGEPWFVARDVCDILDISNARDAMCRLQDSVKGVATIDTLGGPQQLWIINEAGVYKLSFSSRKPEAEHFSDYVAGTILPAIRRTGQYQVKQMSQAELIAAQAQLLVEQERRILAVEGETKATAARVDRIAEAAEPIINSNARDQLSQKIRSTCHRYGLNYQNIYNHLYMMLEAEAHCDLDARVRNKRDRLHRAGALKSQIDDVNRLDVICEDSGLLAQFDRITQRWAMSLAARKEA